MGTAFSRTYGKCQKMSPISFNSLILRITPTSGRKLRVQFVLGDELEIDASATDLLIHMNDIPLNRTTCSCKTFAIRYAGW